MTNGRQQSRMATDVASNLFVRFFGAAINIIVVPFYLHALGPEGFGIVGVNSALTVVVALFDGGLALTVNRELARLSRMAGNEAKMAETLSSSVMMFGVISAAIFVVIWVAAPWAARNWLNVSALSPDIVVYSLRLIGAVLAGQLLSACYQGALYGLHRQVPLNAVVAIGAIVRALSIIAILNFITATPVAFFAGYLAVLVFQVVVLRLVLARDVKIDLALRHFRKARALELLHASAGVGLMAILALLVNQIDKFYVSKLLSLREFGYYMVAVSVAQLPVMVAVPVASSIFPRLSRLSGQDVAGGRAIFHASMDLVASIVLPAGATLALFAKEIVFSWTGNPATTMEVAPIMAILTPANALYAFWILNHYFEVANGRSRAIVHTYLITLVAAMPALYFAIMRYGSMGAATVWLAISVALITLATPYAMRAGLGEEFSRFYMRGIGRPLVISVMLVGLCRALIPALSGRLACGAASVSVFGLAVAACVMSVPAFRARTIRVLKSRQLFQ